MQNILPHRADIMSQVEQKGSIDSHLSDPIKEATLAALNKVLEPLLALMLQAGITVHECNKIVRERAVQAANQRIIKDTGRESKSRIAIITGLPRSEVTKILNSRESVARLKPSQHPAWRVLAAWYDDPHFGDPTGEPAILPIFGKRKSFQRLVDRYGVGIPVRAMLDELIQMDALERLPDQKVRVKSRLPALTNGSSRLITAVGNRGRDLLNTLTHNLKNSSHPLFEATSLIDDADPEVVAQVRREITEQGKNFINGATSLLDRWQKKQASKPARSSKHIRLGVTVYYFQDETKTDNTNLPKSVASRRKNLRRQERKVKISDLSRT